MITIKDQITGKDIGVRLVGNEAVMCCGTEWITETIKPADLSIAKCCILKRDLEGFGSFFNTPLRAERRAA